MSGFITKGVPVGRPFCLLKYQFWLIFAFIYFLPFSLYAQTCGPDRVDEKVQYTYVYDGDTIELKDGRKLRFIGINTPEIGHNESPPQPYAVKARKVLISLLAHNKTLQLRFDAERHDKYNRLLAHVFLSDGSSVAARLLEQGLATTLVIPPNVWNQTCYSEIEHKAMAQKKGLWSLPEYQPVDAAKLTSNHGYQIVRGRIVLGLLVVHNNFWVYAIGLGFFLVSYSAIVIAEETYLQNKFGDEYTAYCNKTGRWSFNFHGLGKTFEDMQFNWRRVILKDYTTMMTWTTTLGLLLIWRTVTFQGLRNSGVTITYMTTAIALLLMTGLGVRLLKKSGRLSEGN